MSQKDTTIIREWCQRRGKQKNFLDVFLLLLTDLCVCLPWDEYNWRPGDKNSSDSVIRSVWHNEEQKLLESGLYMWTQTGLIHLGGSSYTNTKMQEQEGVIQKNVDKKNATHIHTTTTKHYSKGWALRHCTFIKLKEGRHG